MAVEDFYLKLAAGIILYVAALVTYYIAKLERPVARKNMFRDDKL